MDLGLQSLSDITIYTKYAKYIPHKQRRETWEELCYRNRNMHLDRYPQLRDEIIQVYEQFVIPKKVLPSMRSAQFAGKPIELNPSRMFNCSFLPVDDYRAFSETMFLLLGGTGVGYSVQKHHINKLPPVIKPVSEKRYLIGDSIEGWAESIRMLMKAYLCNNWLPKFDFRDIRAKGSTLITAGGKAPGPEPLKICIENIKKILDTIPNGTKLSSLQIHDIQCHIADAVLSGGIRRAAMISLFDIDDEDMLKCKNGEWWKENPQRARSNNSAVVVRHKVKKNDFFDLWKMTEESRSGEPAIYLTNNSNVGCNPCCEASLKNYSFCNLSEINMANIVDQDDYNSRVKVAAFIGTLQAGYTNFHYLRNVWKETTERDALLGVSGTGIATQNFLNLDHAKAVELIKQENKRISKLIGIRSAARTTLVKPAGTASCVLGSSSGIHPWYDKYYLRRMRIGKNENIFNYLNEEHPYMLEDDLEKPNLQSIACFPIEAPESAITRDEGVFNLLNRIAMFSTQWIKPGHVKGDNTHNISATISVKDHEWQDVGNWMWENRNLYNGLSVLPYDGGTYRQTPFESITEDRYKNLISQMKPIDLKRVKEEKDETNLNQQIACGGGGSCELT